MIHIITLAISTALLFLCQPVLANADRKVTENGLIEGSYIVTFKQPTGMEQPLIKPPLKMEEKVGRAPPPFGQHGTGQNKSEVVEALGLNGEVAAIFETINAAHIKMSAEEAERLRGHPAVLNIEQDRILTTQTTQTNPGWGLDRIDQSVPPLNNTYVYSSSGAGQTIYILDSGLNPTYPAVAAEFGGRASVIYDVNGGSGNDCFGHGTEVASAAAGNTHGVAKGASLVIAKITNGCTNGSYASTSVLVFTQQSPI